MLGFCSFGNGNRRILKDLQGTYINQLQVYSWSTINTNKWILNVVTDTKSSKKKNSKALCCNLSFAHHQRISTHLKVNISWKAGSRDCGILEYVNFQQSNILVKELQNLLAGDVFLGMMPKTEHHPNCLGNWKVLILICYSYKIKDNSVV